MKKPQACAANRERIECAKRACLNGIIVDGYDIGSCLRLQKCTYIHLETPIICGIEGDFVGNPDLNHLCHPSLGFGNSLGCGEFDTDAFPPAVGCRGTDCICTKGSACNFRANSYDPDDWDEQCEYTAGGRYLRH